MCAPLSHAPLRAQVFGLECLVKIAGLGVGPYSNTWENRFNYVVYMAGLGVSWPNKWPEHGAPCMLLSICVVLSTACSRWDTSLVPQFVWCCLLL